MTVEEGREIIEEAHSGIYGGHVNGLMLSKKIIRLGYYWPSLEADSVDYVRKCKKCQLHADLIHAPASHYCSMAFFDLGVRYHRTSGPDRGKHPEQSFHINDNGILHQMGRS
ncbi:hypothetical protein MRB53_013834 [Persea americana]|uniref:Uncharacterized protein n=1 Tax=Persea americana TaxID=3435 RepID=A0ACC2K933_PERAE|nr:hypothetical protein MRB53_013834 [Persea americana]